MMDNKFMPMLAFKNKQFDLKSKEHKYSYDKVKDYIEIYLSLDRYNQTYGDQVRYYVPFVNCGEEHFAGIEGSDRKTFKKAFCPDLKQLGGVWNISGATKDSNRSFFSIIMRKCSPLRNAQCKDDSTIDQFMTYSGFSLYNKVGSLQLKNTENPAANPVNHILMFHSEFQIQQNKYTRVKNYINYHSVVTRDNRFNPFGGDSKYQFVDYDQYPAYLRNYAKPSTKMVSYNFGPMNEEDVTMLYKCEFKYSSIRYEHQRTLMNITSLISKVGGFSSVIFSLFGFIAFFFNKGF